MNINRCGNQVLINLISSGSLLRLLISSMLWRQVPARSMSLISHISQRTHSLKFIFGPVIAPVGQTCSHTLQILHCGTRFIRHGLTNDTAAKAAPKGQT